MYPDLPDSPEDLVPLPLGDGPRLKPFDFHGHQDIEFHEFLGEGKHSAVYKVKIFDNFYALKLFDFVEDAAWGLPNSEEHGPITPETFSAFYNYSEPFNRECRAFARLRDTGTDELAIKCYGYVLLNEKNESDLLEEFPDVHPDPNMATARCRFTNDGRMVPRRGIIKELGYTGGDLTTEAARKMLGDIIKLQKLGIVNLDVRHGQLINGKFADFSTALTAPHYNMSMELNPHLTSEDGLKVGYNLFKLSRCDYSAFDAMVTGWNEMMDLEEQGWRSRVKIFALPRLDDTGRYSMRLTPERQSIYTLVDTRNTSHWQSSPPYYLSLTQPDRRRIDARAKKWYYQGDPAEVEYLRNMNEPYCSVDGTVYRDGFFYPTNEIDHDAGVDEDMSEAQWEDEDSQQSHHGDSQQWEDEDSQQSHDQVSHQSHDEVSQESNGTPSTAPGSSSSSNEE